VILDKMPFHVGVSITATNPAGLPDTWPFSLYFDNSLGLLMQRATPDLLGILDDAYRAGQLIGTPLAEDSYGKPYADDFLLFIEQVGLPCGAKAIEIGAGVGYLTRRLKDAGYQIIGIEPGRGYAKYWEKYGVNILNDFFPTPHLTGRFDLICSYAVLEHIAEPSKFLRDVRNQLAPEGVAIFSVPDCTDEISAGDPSILFHEHFSYFDSGSLARLIESVGMHATVVKSGYGRCLYAIASLKERSVFLENDKGVAGELVAGYPSRCSLFIEDVRSKISKLTECGTVGIYCASRGLALFDPAWTLRFFDDDPELQGKFLPPFQVSIETREKLLAEPVDYLVIMSRTFGNRIRSSLREQGYRGEMLTLDQT
jgi:SAM-dependent methyltransferase